MRRNLLAGADGVDFIELQVDLQPSLTEHIKVSDGVVFREAGMVKAGGVIRPSGNSMTRREYVNMVEEMGAVAPSESVSRVLTLESSTHPGQPASVSAGAISDVMDVDDTSHSVPSLGVAASVLCTHEHEVAQALMAEARAAVLAEDEAAPHGSRGSLRSDSDRHALMLEI